LFTIKKMIGEVWTPFTHSLWQPITQSFGISPRANKH
jgi:hypothetical protein